jgi:hypothetical protein
MRSLISILLFINLTAVAHVGSSGVLYQGQAGPYKVLVSLQPPDVIPGTAQVTVYVENGQPQLVEARPVYFRTGLRGAPSPDPLAAVVGQTGQYQGIVWLMSSGASSVQLRLEGKEGKGEIIVPVAATSTAMREMPSQLGLILSILAVLLVVLLVTAISASASDGLLKAGETLNVKQKRAKWLNAGIGLLICTALLYGGSSWWNAWAADYQRYMYRPLEGTGKVLSQNSERVFQVKIDTTQFRRGLNRPLSFLIPDHGKLMHLFLVRQGTLDAFAHLHPERRDTTTFEAYLPKLPAGNYLMYADIVNRSGFAETITDTVTIPAIQGTAFPKTDPEDTYVVTDPLNNPKQIPVDENVVVCGKPGTQTKLKDGSSIIWQGKPNEALEANRPYSLTFEVLEPSGKAAQLEPYLGMNGHAAVVRADGSVYIHLHPVGTLSMASQQSMQGRITDTTRIYRYANPKGFRDSIDRYIANLKALPPADRDQLLMKTMLATHNMKGMSHSNMIVFPYSFPKAGQYRIFVQIKRNGQVLTGIFDAKVKATTL